MNKISLYLILLLVLFQPLLSQSYTEAIRLNQVGFYPDGPKLAIAVESTASQFYITTPDLMDTLYTGELGGPQKWDYSDETVKQADFSDFATIGSYVVLIPDLGYSNVFDIKPRVHQEVARAAIKAYYFQRMSIDLFEEFAGKWFRPMGHPDTEVLVHSSAASPERPEGTILSCPRGWYDAGDYNKYIINSGISTYQMLAAYEHFPEYCRELETNIPESGNTIPDVLDECLWNIRWMLTMQDPNDGGVYHKCSHANFSGAVMPHQATAPRYVVQKSSTAALDFAAVMAQTSRIFREFEAEFPGFADSCLTAARAAWKWARANPETYYRQNNNNQLFEPAITTGEYGDNNDDDEFRWAAAELYVTTREDSFVVAVNPITNNPSVPDWRSVGTLGLYSMAHHRQNLTAAIDTSALKNILIQFADEIKRELSNSAYHVMLTQFPWGSNAVAANQSMAVLQAFKLTGNSDYLNAATENLDYLLGRNATTYCFVSDIGDKPPMNFHHRQSEADDVVEPIPGLLAGGPNPSQQDNCPGYPSDLPARSYIDDWCSYASNEICINWNAPLVYVAAGIEAVKSSTGKPVSISVTISSPSANETFTSSDVIRISAATSIDAGSIQKVEFYADNKKIGESDSAPFTINWENAQPGLYQLLAKAVGDQGDFRTSLPVGVIIFNSESAGNILFVVGSTELNSGDYAIQNRLVQNNYHVTLQDDEAAPFLVDNKDGILISSTIASPRDIRLDLVGINIPLISWEYPLFDDFGWTGRKRDTDYGMSTGSTLKIVNDSHPIAAGFSGAVQVCDTDEDLIWGLPNENADVIATLDDDTNNDNDHAAIFAYETGSLMLKDMQAKARRVGLYFQHETAAGLTDDGWTLFLQAVAWAVEGERMAVDAATQTIPLTTGLLGNYPNPFNPQTQISYSLGQAADVTLTVYNAVGQRIATLIDSHLPAGKYRIVWDGRDFSGATVSNGIYYYQLAADAVRQTRKMVLLK